MGGGDKRLTPPHPSGEPQHGVKRGAPAKYQPMLDHIRHEVERGGHDGWWTLETFTTRHGARRCKNRIERGQIPITDDLDEWEFSYEHVADNASVLKVRLLRR